MGKGNDTEKHRCCVVKHEDHYSVTIRGVKSEKTTIHEVINEIRNAPSPAEGHFEMKFEGFRVDHARAVIRNVEVRSQAKSIGVLTTKAGWSSTRKWFFSSEFRGRGLQFRIKISKQSTWELARSAMVRILRWFAWRFQKDKRSLHDELKDLLPDVDPENIQIELLDSATAKIERPEGANGTPRRAC